MATNVVYRHTDTLFLAVPSGIASGDPFSDGPASTADVGIGINGVALTDRDANGNATLQMKPYTAVRVTVLATTDDSSLPTGGAVARGDAVYKNASTEVLSKDADGLLFGFALGNRDANGAYPDENTIASGSQAAIDVMLA